MPSKSSAGPHSPTKGIRSARTRVALERGKRWVFATALDWPGWCRRGRGDDDALEVLLAYRDRYGALAGKEFAPGPIQVVGSVDGNATTDFGAPGTVGPWDHQPLDRREGGRQVDLLITTWCYLDDVIEGAPSALRKGPRGGGRDRDAIAAHVRNAERSYASKAGVRIPPRTPWSEQRTTLANELRSGVPAGTWPARYAIRRVAWHVLDHAWEIEDRSE
jgi:hypothetical protein